MGRAPACFKVATVLLLLCESLSVDVLPEASSSTVTKSHSR